MKENSNTWVVGFIKDDPKKEENTWSVVGVYDSEEKAAKVCTTENHFVGPLVINETNDDGDFDFSDVDKSPWPGMWFPFNFKVNPWTEEQIQNEKYPREPKLK
jgi:hypothetical protein